MKMPSKQEYDKDYSKLCELSKKQMPLAQSDKDMALLIIGKMIALSSYKILYGEKSQLEKYLDSFE